GATASPSGRDAVLAYSDDIVAGDDQVALADRLGVLADRDVQGDRDPAHRERQHRLALRLVGVELEGALKTTRSAQKPTLLTTHVTWLRKSNVREPGMVNQSESDVFLPASHQDGESPVSYPMPGWHGEHGHQPEAWVGVGCRGARS